MKFDTLLKYNYITNISLRSQIHNYSIDYMFIDSIIFYTVYKPQTSILILVRISILV